LGRVTTTVRTPLETVRLKGRHSFAGRDVARLPGGSVPLRREGFLVELTGKNGRMGPLGRGEGNYKDARMRKLVPED